MEKKEETAREKLRAYIEREKNNPDNPLIGIRIFARESDDTTDEAIAAGVLDLIEASENHRVVNIKEDAEGVL